MRLASIVGTLAMTEAFPTVEAAAAEKSPRARVTYQPVAFTDLPGWSEDEHQQAYAAFLKSCQRLIVLARTPREGKARPDERLLPLCILAEQLAGKPSREEARAFFELNFVPHRVVHNGPKALLTAYYEPLIAGSRTPDARFKAPIYKRPGDLVNVVDEAQRGAVNGTLTHGRMTPAGLVPYATRAEIDQGALAGKGLELLYLEDPVDVFFMQIQGSARIKLPDGSTIRIGYDGKNGHPYTSIGRVLIERGEIPVERMSLQALATWLKANVARAREAMWANKSYVFFREYAGAESRSPQGVHEIPLTPGRSLAVDAGYHSIGTPVYLAAPELTHIAKGGLHRLMIAQDVGSAIKGPERGDIYVGSGDKAGKIAGVTKHSGTFYVLLPKAAATTSATRSTPAATTTDPALRSSVR